VEMAEVPITDRTPASWRSVQSCGAMHPNVAFVAVRRADGTLRFGVREGEDLAPGDHLIVAGGEEDVCAMAVAAREFAAAA